MDNGIRSVEAKILTKSSIEIANASLFEILISENAAVTQVESSVRRVQGGKRSAEVRNQGDFVNP